MKTKNANSYSNVDDKSKKKIPGNHREINFSFQSISDHKITKLYRDVAGIIRKNGARRIYIIKSRIQNSENRVHIILELVVDQITDYKKTVSEIQNNFPEIDCKLIEIKSTENYELLKEAEEDGIQI